MPINYCDKKQKQALKEEHLSKGYRVYEVNCGGIDTPASLLEALTQKLPVYPEAPRTYLHAYLPRNWAVCLDQFAYGIYLRQESPVFIYFNEASSLAHKDIQLFCYLAQFAFFIRQQVSALANLKSPEPPLDTSMHYVNVFSILVGDKRLPFSVPNALDVKTLNDDLLREDRFIVQCVNARYEKNLRQALKRAGYHLFELQGVNVTDDVSLAQEFNRVFKEKGYPIETHVPINWAYLWDYFSGDVLDYNKTPLAVFWNDAERSFRHQADSLVTLIGVMAKASLAWYPSKLKLRLFLLSE